MKPSIDLVKEYLETLGQEDVAGKTNDIRECPVALALKWKYPEAGPITVTEHTYYSDDERGYHPQEIVDLIQLIDNSKGSERPIEPITRREVEQFLRKDSDQ